MNEKIDTPDAQGDRALIKAFLNNDKSAFDKLVLKYKDKVFNLCYRFLGNYAETDDCAQETFVKVFRSLRGFRLESSFSTWLYRIAVNTCKNKVSSLEYRHRKGMVRLNNPIETERGAYSIEIRDESLSPDVILQKKEKEQLIQKAIESLEEEQRIVVVLRDIQGLSYEEISQITGLKLGTVKSRLARAKERLIEKLKGMI